MAINLNNLECFLCWKALNNSQTVITNEKVVSSFEISKQQADNCKKYLKSDIVIKCTNQNIKIQQWESENFCSVCCETSETLTVLIEVLEDTERELNLVVDLFNEQILNERRKKLNSSLSANIDSDTGNLSDGFSGDDFLNNEEDNDDPNNCSEIGNASNGNVSKESNKRSLKSKSPDDNEKLRFNRSKKRKLENENLEKSTKKSNKTIPKIILEKISAGVTEIMQEKLIERLIRDGIITQPPRNYKSKNVGFRTRESELGDENKLFVVKPAQDENNDVINCNVEIKDERYGFSSDDFDNGSECFNVNEETERTEKQGVENSGLKIMNSPLKSSKNLRINVSRLKLDVKGRKKKPITLLTTKVAKTAEKVTTKATSICKNMSSEIENSNVESETQNDRRVSKTPQQDADVEGVLDDNKARPKLLKYKCESCKFLAASFEELFHHKSTHNPNQPMKCTKCNKQFEKTRSFFTHMRYHTLNSSYVLLRPPKKRLDVSKVNYKCNYCHKSFSSGQCLNRHQKNLHTKQETNQFECKITGKMFLHYKRSLRFNINTRPFECKDCKLSFPTAERLAFHQRKQQDDKTSKVDLFECKVCGSIYARDNTLQRHMRNHTGIKPFKCKACDKSFTNGHLYRFHQKHHISTFDFICERENCGKKFKIVQELSLHKRHHMKQDYLIENDKGKYYQCPDCEKTFKKKCSKEFVNHMLTHELKFICSICENKFTTKISLDEHHMAEHGNRYPCKLCSQTFSYKASLTGHMKTVHAESRVHICEECGASFKHMKGLTRHLKILHPKESEPTIKCDKCDRMFFCREHMKTHRSKVHISRQCEMCGIHVKNLQKHMQTHNTVLFDCDLCDKKFKQKASLNSHKRAIHKGQQKECKHCGRKFNSADSLRLHLRTHTGEKPYECSVCGKRFDRKHNITTHMRFHTGEKPYKCGKCGNQFSRKDNLNTHVKKCSSG